MKNKFGFTFIFVPIPYIFIDKILFIVYILFRIETASYTSELLMQIKEV